VRHALLAAAFGVLLLLPMVSLVAPPLRVFVQQRSAPAPVMGTAMDRPFETGRSNVGATPEAPRSNGVALSTLLFTGWFAAMALFLLPVAMGLWQVRALRRTALPWRHAQPVVDRLALEVGIRRRVEVLLHATLSGPMTCGTFHPAIVLPQEAETWAVEDLNRAMVHELEHVRRRDWVSHCLARALCAVYWFHPLVWIAWRHLTLDAERACDDAVLGRSEATAYADQLVGLAKRLSNSTKPPLLAMANRADLSTRVSAVLDGRQRRGRAGKRSVSIACGVAVLLVLGLAPLKMVAAPQAAGANAGVALLPEFRSVTTMTLADVTVSDRDGKAIEGLRSGDLVVSEDGSRQFIDVFEPVKPESLPSYYVVGYYSRNQAAEGQYRKITITTPAQPEAKLNYRAGYYAARRSDHEVTWIGTTDGVTFPVPVAKPEAQYSEEARKKKWQGTVMLRAQVDASGRVSEVTMIRGLGLGLDEKGCRGGQAVEV
jgi:beta-lactamase regulating signal transducer with metallopeptidase domain